MKEHHIYIIQILFVTGITIGSRSIDIDNRHKWFAIIARYVLYFLTVEGTKGACKIIYDVIYKKCYLNTAEVLDKVNRDRVLLALTAAVVVLYNDLTIFTEDFPMLFIAHLIVNYPFIKNAGGPSINYGTGMACSFFEGYLMQVLPSDGYRFDGFEMNISAFESREGVVFPVKKLFLVITRSLHCPPDLKHFNKPNRNDLPKLEAIQLLGCKSNGCGDENIPQSLDVVVKDVAGVKNRSYLNSAYKIYRPHQRPVCLTVECASPLHTLSRVLKNRPLYEELSNINVEEVVEDFCTTLRRILAKSPECKGKCELVYFDDTDPEQNLADVLLDKIRELEPNFENIVRN